MKNIAVIGGGASGLIAAISAAEHENVRVTIYEKTDRVGKKILATGNGRCNITNMGADIKNYHGETPKFVLGAMNRFSVSNTLDFFNDLGVVLKTESEGKVYPYSDQASSVLDVLRFRAEALNINVITNFEVCELIKTKNEFSFKSYNGDNATADKVIFAVGGKASPQLGTNGSGYNILTKLGHFVTALYPSLVQIKTETNFVKALKGIKINSKISVLINNKIVNTQSGEVLFTDYGLSGPPIFQLSRLVAKNKDTVVSLDIMPEYSFEQIKNMLFERRNSHITLENYFVGMLNKRLGQTIFKVCNITPFSRKSDTLTNQEIIQLATIIKDWKIKTIGTMSWNNAQVTSGGIKTKDINPTTMESKIVEGLYITGEILDIDGDCGGYNLQWAWSSGYVAGKSAAER